MRKPTTDHLQAFGRNAEERVAKALKELHSGRGILLVDDEDRENEGDLVFSAEKMDVADMALMIRHCSGVVCLCLTNEKAEALQLPYMVKDNSSAFHTPFTVSVDAKNGITTGLSASDRIAAVKAACSDEAQPGDLVRPGHLYPLRANDLGVLGRNGHTEGSVDLMKLAGLKPAAVLCELMNDDGTMARLPQIIAFANTNGLTLLSIKDIIEYRKALNKNEGEL